MYAIYFFVLFSAIRSIFQRVSLMWLWEAPNAERLYRMCMEIYISRDRGILELEKYIFEKLLFILRSSEIIVTITRNPNSRYNGRLIIKKL